MTPSLGVICLYSTETTSLSFDYEEENSSFLSDSFVVGFQFVIHLVHPCGGDLC